MAILGVDDFKSKLRGGGARANLFKATINFPAYAQGDVEITSFLCSAASLPASTVNSFPFPFRGRQLKMVGDRTFEPWTTTIINDTDFKIRDSIERWMNGMNGHKSNTGLTNTNDFSADLVIEQLDRDGTTLKTVNLRGCFPIALSEIVLSYGSTDQIEEFTCTWELQYWESNTTT